MTSGLLCGDALAVAVERNPPTTGLCTTVIQFPGLIHRLLTQGERVMSRMIWLKKGAGSEAQIGSPSQRYC
jgi:hypothetical protein